MSSYTNSINNEIYSSVSNSSLGNKIEAVNKFIGDNGHDVTSFIYFKVNQFELDTRDPNSFKHYAISLENQKTGVGQGNQFTLKIAFHKDFSHLNETINSFEEMLSTLRNASLNLSDKTATKDVLRNRCILKYGYVSNNNNLVTDTYEGMLLQYKVTANKQIVEYTLSGYSGEKAAIGTVNWYPKIKGMSKNSYGEKIADLMEAKEANSLTESQITELITELNNEYTGPIKCNPYDALKMFLADYNEEIKNISLKENVIPVTFKIVLANGLTEEYMKTKLRPVVLSLCRNQTPLDYIKYIVSMFVEDTGDDYAITYMKQQLKIVDRWVYEFKYSSSSGNEENIVEVLISKISSDENDVYDYYFKGYTLDNNLLIDYTLNYDGTVALAVSNTMESDANDNMVYINSIGQITRTASVTNDMFVAGAIDNTLVQKQNTWLDRMSCANNCTMTTFGLPFEIPVSSVFKVNFYIGNTPHHESGRCFVTGIVDRIENGMFTTNFTMIRLPGKGEDVK